MKSKITMRSVLSAIVCLAILFSFCACKDGKVTDASSIMTDIESEAISSEKLSQDEESSREQTPDNTETSSKQQKPEDTTTSSKPQQTETSSKEEDKPQSSSSQKPSNNSQTPSRPEKPETSSSEASSEEVDDGKVTSLMELYKLKAGDKAYIAIDPYWEGEYTVVRGNYEDNKSTVIEISFGLYAIKNAGPNNAWVKDYPSGNLVAHKGFNGFHDESIIHKKECATTGVYPTNTIQSVQQAISLGFKMVEIDITVAKNGTWVLSHDSDLRTINDSEQKIYNTLYGEFSSLPIKKAWTCGTFWNFSDKIKPEYVPKLADVLAKVKDEKVFLILDAKFIEDYQFTESDWDNLAAIIERFDMADRCAAYAAASNPLAQRLEDIVVAYTGIPHENEEIAINNMRSNKNFMFSVSLKEFEKVKTFAKKYDVPVAVWLTDDYKEAAEYFKNGADYVLTNSLLVNPKMDYYTSYKSLSMSGKSQTLDYDALALRVGDVIEVSAEVSSSSEAFIKIATVGAPRERKTEIIAKGKTTLYYIVNDKYEYDLAVTIGAKSGTPTVKNAKIKIYRDNTRIK